MARQLRPPARVGLIALGAMIFAVVVAGCQSDRRGSSYPCNVAKGEYLDFETGACVAPGEDWETLYRVYNYWRLDKRARETDDPILHQVSFSEYQSAVSFRAAVEDAAIQHVDAIAYYVPAVLGGWYTIEHIPSTSTKETVVEDGEALLRESSFTPAESENSDAMARAVDEQNYKIGGMRITARPSAIAAWWKSQSELVRLVQPAAGPLGKTQKLFLPGEEVQP